MPDRSLPTAEKHDSGLLVLMMPSSSSADRASGHHPALPCGRELDSEDPAVCDRGL